MGWEFRNGSRYYYQKKRIGGRVRSIYVGAGIVGELAENLDATQRVDQLASRIERDAHDALDGRIDELCRIVETMTREALIGYGFHLHKGQWRRRRNGSETCGKNNGA
jgi:hypothetical protein